MFHSEGSLIPTLAQTSGPPANTEGILPNDAAVMKDTSNDP